MFVFDMIVIDHLKEDILDQTPQLLLWFVHWDMLQLSGSLTTKLMMINVFVMANLTAFLRLQFTTYPCLTHLYINDNPDQNVRQHSKHDRGSFTCRQYSINFHRQIFHFARILFEAARRLTFTPQKICIVDDNEPVEIQSKNNISPGRISRHTFNVQSNNGHEFP